MATMRDVAKYAGVSVATVSRVLNNNGYVNEETKAKVMDAIEKFNYKPNELARTLYTRRSKMIGLIVPDITNPFFPELARSIEDVTNAKEYTFVLCNSDGQLEKEKNYINVLKQKYVDGLIVVTSTLTSEHIEELDIPVVALDRSFGPNIPNVCVENEKGARLAVEHLQQLGCKKIAHIAGPGNVSNAQLRLKGYIDKLTETGVFDPELVAVGDYQFHTAKLATIDLLKKHPDIDGIFVGNDLMAVGALKAAEALGIKVPEQLSIIGFDGITIGDITTPSLTTIAQPIYEMGAKATTLLLNLIEGNPIPELQHLLPVELIERESTKKGVVVL